MNAKFEKVKRQGLQLNNVGMEHTHLPDGAILLSQVKYAEALGPLVLVGSAAQTAQQTGSAAQRAQPEDTKPLTPAGVTQVRGGIGAVLF